MNFWHFTPYVILYIIATIIAFSLAISVSKLKSVKGVTYFRLLTFFSGIWTLSYTLMVFSTHEMFKLIMLRIEYLGIIGASVFWFLFAFTYTNQDKWLTKKLIGLICIIPVVTYLQILTLNYHHFYYQSFDFIKVNGLVVLDKTSGPGYYLWIFYSYFLLISGAIVLVRGILNMPLKHRRQIVAIILILIIIIIPNMLYVFDKNPIDPYDPTCLSFVIVGMLFFALIYYDKFLNIVPVAYNMVFRSTKSGVIIINQHGTILDVNPSAERIFDSSQYAMIGQDIKNYIEDIDNLYSNLQGDKEYTGEFEFETKDQYFELITASLQDYKKRIIGRILVFYNITKRKHALNELDAYARTVAHDLKSPMNSVLGFAQLLKESKNLNDEELIYCDYIYNGIHKMTDIIDGLLLLAQVRNQDDIDSTPIHMKKILDRVFYRLEGLINSSNAKFDISDSWPDAVGYPIWIEEVWVNYISNAIKYGGTPPYIQLGATELDDSVKYWIKDNGEGLSQNEIDNLFKEFSRLKHEKSKIQGYGLGLSIVERIIKKLGGTVGVESCDESGTCFYFTLPKFIK